MALVNTGDQGWRIIKEVYLDDNSETGIQMPNIAMISPQAIVDISAIITYPYPNDVTPGGTPDGSIWYNPNADELFKKISGTWVLLTDRVTNDAYIEPAENLTDCPV